MADQIRRAVTSIALNVAEGYSRQSDNELRHFLLITRGSAAGVDAQLLICVELNYFTREEMTEALNLCDEVKRKLYHFILRTRKWELEGAGLLEAWRLDGMIACKLDCIDWKGNSEYVR